MQFFSSSCPNNFFYMFVYLFFSLNFVTLSRAQKADGEFFNYDDEEEFGETEDTVYILEVWLLPNIFHFARSRPRKYFSHIRNFPSSILFSSYSYCATALVLLIRQKVVKNGGFFHNSWKIIQIPTYFF